MNEGRYPDRVINEAIRLVKKGTHPKDAADELREKYSYAKLHPKTVTNWCRKFPLGKTTPLLPPKVDAAIRDIARDEAQRRADLAKQEEEMKRHHQDLKPTLLELREIGPFPLLDYDLARWHSRPDPCWPIAKAKVCRAGGGKLTIRLDAEGKQEWKYLNQHLTDDPVWAAIEGWEQAMAKDIEARLALLQAIVKRIEGPTAEGALGLPVRADMGAAGTPEPAVSLYYAFTIHDQVLSQALGLRHAPLARGLFTLEGSSTIHLGGHPVISSPDQAQREAAIEFLLRVQMEWVSLPEVGVAAEAYRQAEAKTSAVKGHVERLRLRVAFPPGSTCDACRGEAT